MTRPEVHARFRRVVERAIEKADREHAAHLAALRVTPSAPRVDWKTVSRATAARAGLRRAGKPR